MADKVDLRRLLDGYRARRGQLRELEMPDLTYLMIDGHGDPNTSLVYAEALQALYPVAYATKFLSKAELGRDYVVPPLEGLWLSADMEAFTSSRDKAAWSWTLMLLTPDWIDASHVASAVERVAATGDRPRLGEVRWATLSEGQCVQTLHVGSYDDEGRCWSGCTRMSPRPGCT